MRSSTAQKNGCIKRKVSVSKQNRSDFVSLRGLRKNGTLILIESAFIQPRTLVSQIKTLHFRVIARPRRGRAIFKPKAWHPVARQGSTRREEIPITGTARRAVPPSLLSPPHFQIPVRSVSPRFVPECRFIPFKIAASGARALLAMTNLIGLVGKQNGFRNKTFEKR